MKLGKIEKSIIGYLFLNAVVSVLGYTSVVGMGFGILGGFLAVSLLAYRYIQDHRKDMHG